MSDLNRDAAAIWDMVRAIREIQEFTADFSEDSFLETLWIKRVGRT
ncbi:hypothetical protein [Adonisia turfae]|nr:hypothetical protein [Adonisia turfae]